MSLRRKIWRFAREDRGSTIIEFALLAPVFLAMMFGVFQVGVQLQRYNALRSIASDGSRYVAIEYQKENKLTSDQMENAIISFAISDEYLLKQTDLDVRVDKQATSRITGAQEYAISMDYALPNWLSFIGVGDRTIRYTRPIFLPMI